jgi:hypothetical protein
MVDADIPQAPPREDKDELDKEYDQGAAAGDGKFRERQNGVGVLWGW